MLTSEELREKAHRAEEKIRGGYLLKNKVAGAVRPLKRFIERNAVKAAAVSVLGTAPLAHASAGVEHASENHAETHTVTADIHKTLTSVPASGIYKGLKIDYASLRARDIGHIYESGMKATITDGNRPIETASYIGLYQMSLRNGDSMSRFIAEYGSEFPELKGKNLHSRAFYEAYKKYAVGPQAKHFEQRQFDYMWENRYKAVFDKLAELPGLPKITKENCDNDEYKVFAGAVMSCVNQNPRRTYGIFNQAYQQVKKQFGTINEENRIDFLADVTLESYNVRSKIWPSIKNRYLAKDGEKELCENAYNYCKARTAMSRMQRQAVLNKVSAQQPKKQAWSLTSPEMQKFLSTKMLRR